MDRGVEVLVASWDEGLRGRVALALDGDRFTVVEAATTDEAVQRVAERPPAVLLADLRLDGRGALALARALRRQADTAGVRVLVLAEPGAELGEDAEVVDGVLATPFTSLALLRRLESLLGA